MTLVKPRGCYGIRVGAILMKYHAAGLPRGSGTGGARRLHSPFETLGAEADLPALPALRHRRHMKISWACAAPAGGSQAYYSVSAEIILEVEASMLRLRFGHVDQGRPGSILHGV